MLNKFFGNLLLGEKNLLDNREMQIKTIFETNDALKSKEKSKEKILQIIANNPCVTTRELSELVGLSIAGIEKNMRQMKEKGLIRRIGPDRGGYWEVLEV